MTWYFSHAGRPGRMMALLTAAGCAFVFAGCADGQLPTYPVSGQVVFPDGTPVKSGTIELESVEHNVNARGEIQPDGSFELSTYEPGDGAVAGRHRVVIVQMIVSQGERAIHHDHAAGVRSIRAVSPKYSRYETSELTVDVSADRENEMRIVVDPAPQP